MSRPYFSLMLYVALFLSGAMVHGDQPKPSPTPPPQKIPAHPLIAEQRFDVILARMNQGSAEAEQLFRLYGENFSLSQLLNTIKHASKRELRMSARLELERRGVPLVDVVEVLTLEEWLLDPDPVVRYRASAQLAEWKSPLRTVAVKTLKDLIAAETHPDLKWMHAVTLSSIVPNRGSALDILNGIPENANLRQELQLNHPLQIPKERSANERAISEMTLSVKDYITLTQRLRSGHLAGPKPHPKIANYLSPASTKITPGSRVIIPKSPVIARNKGKVGRVMIPAFAQNEPRENLGGTVTGQFVFGDFAPSSAKPFALSSPPEPPPPPQKKPAPRLIAEQRFDKILEMMDQDSEEAWKLFQLYGDSFPQSTTAKYCIARAFSSDSRARERGQIAMWHVGGDAENAAALSYAIGHDLCLTHQVEMIDRVEQPGPFMRRALKRIRHHENPRMRTAILHAMARAEGMEALLLEMVKQSLHSNSLQLNLAAVQVIAELESDQSSAHDWIKEESLKSKEPLVLAAIASALKDVPFPAEFKKEIVQRMERETNIEINMILNRCLLDHAENGSQEAKQLEALHEALVKLWLGQMYRGMVVDLRELIKQGKDTKMQTQIEAIKQLEELNLLD